MTTINGQELSDNKQPQLTSAQQLEFIRRCVKWTLWKIATHQEIEMQPGDNTPEQTAAQQEAQRLFQDSAWVAEVTGSFAANTAKRSSAEQSIDYLAFLGLSRAQDAAHCSECGDLLMGDVDGAWCPTCTARFPDEPGLHHTEAARREVMRNKGVDNG